MSRVLWIILGLVVLTVLGLQAAYSNTVIAIQPLGAVAPALIEAIQRGVQGMYNVEIAVLPAKELPQHAYYKPRNRYRADKLLDELDGIRSLRYTKILGVTTSDISTTKGKYPDWGIFGLSRLGGRSCVVSTYRLRQGNASETLLRSRLIKVVNHELGHTFGLPHCPEIGCLMEDAKGTIKTVDNETGALCPQCKAKLGKELQR